MKYRNEGGLWTTTLFAANEIPSVVVTFVAVIIFLQMNMGVALSTLFSALLLLPWVLQPFMRRLLPHSGSGRVWLLLTEFALALALGGLALTVVWGRWWTLGMLMLTSVLATLHDLLARRYYKSRVMYARTSVHSHLRTLSAQMATVMTYGLMIMAVGGLQIYFRYSSAVYSWSLATYVLCGVYLLLLLSNLLLLGGATNALRTEDCPMPWRRPGWGRQLFHLSLMLLPQGLMFYSRTAFLLARPQQGGLGCTLQEVGFAHGTIGVIAYLLGVALGRWLGRRYANAPLRWMLKLSLGMSPLVYVLMTFHRPANLLMLSAYTFVAQLLFGLGLNACRGHIDEISGERYQNAVNPLHIPVISMCIMLPMAASGHMVEAMGYRVFFMFDVLCAVMAWALVWIIRKK